MLKECLKKSNVKQNLPEAILHIGTVNPNYKMTAENIQELLERMEYGELEKEDFNHCQLDISHS